MLQGVQDFTTVDECDPTIEACQLNQGEFNAVYPKTDMYIFQAVSLVNAIFPVVYYLASQDYDNTRSSWTRRIEEPVVGQTKSGSQRSSNRRKRGDKDDNIWKGVAGAHTAIWGVNNIWFMISRFGFLEKYYAYWIKNIISNMAPIVYLGSIIALSIDAADTDDRQGYIEMAVYAIFFGVALYGVELTHGVGAVRGADPEYPYIDKLLIPSFLYTFGLVEHKMSVYAQIKSGEATDIIPTKQGEGTAQESTEQTEDVEIENFNVTF